MNILKAKAESQAMKKQWERAYSAHYMEHPEQLLGEECSSRDKGIMDSYIRKSRHGYRYFMFTINPKPEVTLSEFHKKIKKCITKKWIGKWMYNLEQRSDDCQNIYGIHCNIFIEVAGYKRPSDCMREVYNTFKNCVGHKRHVCMRKNVDKARNFIRYCMGKKADENKSDIIDCDNLWRDYVDLQHYYTNMTEDEIEVLVFALPAVTGGEGLANTSKDVEVKPINPGKTRKKVILIDNLECISETSYDKVIFDCELDNEF